MEKTNTLSPSGAMTIVDNPQPHLKLRKLDGEERKLERREPDNKQATGKRRKVDKNEPRRNTEKRRQTAAQS